MPYHNPSELPEAVKNVLPKHGQEIYAAAFNNALEQYQEKEKRHDPQEDLESLCHKVAWSAVKVKYHKDEKGHWVKND